MGIVTKTYYPYDVTDGVEYYSIGTVAELVGKSVQTIRLWDSWSEDLASNGSERLIPASHRIGKNKTRCWTEDEIQQIVEFSKNLKYGDIAPLSRTRWGEKSNNLKQDRSTEARQATKQYRTQVNKNAKKIQQQQKADEIKKARGSMLKTIRKKARQIVDDAHRE